MLIPVLLLSLILCLSLPKDDLSTIGHISYVFLAVCLFIVCFKSFIDDSKTQYLTICIMSLAVFLEDGYPLIIQIRNFRKKRKGAAE